MNSQTLPVSAGDAPRAPAQYQKELVVLTSLFFMWGFITCMNDILIPKLKAVFSLSYSQAMLVQLAFFGAYGLFSLPSGRIVARVGYQRGMVLGLVIAAVGCLGFLPAASSQAYSLFLGSLFVMACGITLLQVSANPYVAALGHPKTASARLTLTQAFNSLGTFVAPFVGASLILSAASGAAADPSVVQGPYLGLAIALLLLALFIAQAKLPILTPSEETNPRDAALNGEPSERRVSVWQQRHLVLGALGIFLYVGGEVAIGSFLVNYLGEPHIAGMSEADAGQFVAYYWGGAMVGRFVGAAAMRRVAPTRALALAAAAVIVLLITTMSTSGAIAMWTVVAVGLFNSIMFPTIFSLALSGLGALASQGSGILCTAILGGALVPYLQGLLADSVGVQPAFILPTICYAYILGYALWGAKPRDKAMAQ